MSVGTNKPLLWSMVRSTKKKTHNSIKHAFGQKEGGHHSENPGRVFAPKVEVIVEKVSDTAKQETPAEPQEKQAPILIKRMRLVDFSNLSGKKEGCCKKNNISDHGVGL